MRVGEDVDLIWRLHEAGWRIRYDPAVLVAHHEPASWRELLARRYRYGTSAAALAQRHPGDIVHLVFSPGRPRPSPRCWPGVPWLRPLRSAAAGATGVPAAPCGRAPRRTDPATVTATRQTWLGLGRYGTQFAAPLLVAAIAAPARSKAARLSPHLPALGQLPAGAGPASRDRLAAGWAAADRLGGGVADAGSASVHAGPDRRRYRLRGWRLVWVRRPAYALSVAADHRLAAAANRPCRPARVPSATSPPPSR